MDLKHLIDIYTTFPTAIFSLAFLILSFYWLTSLILGFDQDLGVEISNSGFFITLGLSKVPLCIGLTITSFIGLFISASIQEYFLLNIFNYFGLEINSYSIYYLLLTIPLFFVILATSMYLTGMILKPINHVFEIKKSELIKSYNGKTAIVNSLTLDDEFGQIKIEIDGDTLLKHAHTDKEKLKEGDEVIVINFNEEKNSLLVRKFEI